MNFYSKELFLDQFTPVSIYEKVKREGQDLFNTVDIVAQK